MSAWRRSWIVLLAAGTLAACQERVTRPIPEPREQRSDGRIEWPEDFSRRAVQCVAFFSGTESEEPWLMGALGRIHRGDEIQTSARWVSGHLQATIRGGWPGFEETIVSLDFAMDHPFAPRVDPAVHFYSDALTSFEAEDLTGSIHVEWVGEDSPEPSWAENGWSGREPAMVSFDLHGRNGDEPVCFHAAFPLDPGSIEGGP